ncbi:MAG TPA: DinB family protein [Bryobacteraceae bacterium]|nr:DinB family protein [Bryobacteraceae bacterium]
MKLTIPALLAFGFACTLQAQNIDAAIKDLQQSYAGIKNNVLAAAEEMPDSDYDFKLTSAQRSFGAWVAHVAEAQMRSCSAITGSGKKSDAGSKTSKADLMAALKTSFEECDAAYSGTTPENYLAPARTFRGEVPRISSLYGNIAHDQECYGNMVGYLRSKGLVPPSTERMQKMMKGRTGGKR